MVISQASTIKFSQVKLILTIIAGAIISVTFEIFNIAVDFSEIGIMLYSSGIFILATRNPHRAINKSIEKIGQNISLYVYIFHLAVGTVINIGAKIFMINEAQWYLWLRPIIVVSLTILLSFIIYDLNNYIKKSLKDKGEEHDN